MNFGEIMDMKETIEIVLGLANKFALEKKGSLFIITDKDMSKQYDLLYPDLFSNRDINIKNNAVRIVIEKLADLDGAFIIDTKGKIIAYGAKIKKTKVFLGHGTRHSAALGVSKIDNVMAILSSEEDGLVRIFKKGLLNAEINPFTGKNKKFYEKLADLFTKPEIQVATSGGVASLLIGINPLLAGAIFTGSWIVTKYGMASVKDFINTGRIVVKENIANIKTNKK